MGTRRAETLGELFRQRLPVNLQCRACGHGAALEPAFLIRRAGAGARPADLNWRCSRCGSRSVIVRSYPSPDLRS